MFGVSKRKKCNGRAGARCQAGPLRNAISHKYLRNAGRRGVVGGEVILAAHR